MVPLFLSRVACEVNKPSAQQLLKCPSEPLNVLRGIVVIRGALTVRSAAKTLLGRVNDQTVAIIQYFIHLVVRQNLIGSAARGWRGKRCYCYAIIELR